MNFLQKNIIFAIAILVASLVSERGLSKPYHVILDPGHGGRDVGSYVSGVKESNIVLNISLYLEKLLRKDKRFRVTLTRREDVFVSLNKRARIAEVFDGDVLLSIHANSFKEKHFHGVEFYFQNQFPPQKESMLLAFQEKGQLASSSPSSNPSPFLKNLKDETPNIIRDMKRNYRIKTSSRLAKFLSSEWTGVKMPGKYFIKQAPFFVLKKVNVPAVLVEVGFLSNPTEKRKLLQSSYQRKIAKELHLGLVRFKEFIDKKK